MSDIKFGKSTLVHNIAPEAEIAVEKLRKVSDGGEVFTDNDFDLEDSVHLNTVKEVLRLGEINVRDKTKPIVFVSPDGLSSCDVSQGALGDCWFLSALSCVAADDMPGTIVGKIKKETIPSCVGGYKFKFFRMGEWVDVVVDDRLPVRRRASESATNEFWVPLTEKAYAKFNGGYTKLVGGQTCWALTDLSGGIAVELKDFAFVKDDKKAGINIESKDGNENINKGLISGHAYALLNVETVALKDDSSVEMVNIRNPWGRTEWDGDWSDKDTVNWNRVSEEEKNRLGFEVKDDGSFWMTVKDWVDEFEVLTICALPGMDLEDEDGHFTEEEKIERDTRVIGTFTPGVNAPRDVNHLQKVFLDHEFGIQIEMDIQKYIKETTRLIWLQFLVDSPLKDTRYIMVNIYKKT
ncbi:unnamed protein product [Oikopleura dioica]|uniref:Calpain catalytic domain-containing protein n=1 Tax=Oikopleura dioica TaxID=34765 RepID=E4YDB9_OIKDI|nr:unnamed protein product [Oikopleura dioica]